MVQNSSSKGFKLLAVYFAASVSLAWSLSPTPTQKLKNLSSIVGTRGLHKNALLLTRRRVSPAEGIHLESLTEKLKKNSNRTSDLKIGVVRTRWNSYIVERLVEGARAKFQELGVKEEGIREIEVAGAFELPLATRLMALSNKVDAILPIGCLFKGETSHYEYIADAVAHGLMKVQLETMTPVIYGVLTCLTKDQAVERSRGENNHGFSWAMTAVEMALLRKMSIHSLG